MNRNFRLRPAPGMDEEVTAGGKKLIDRRDFVRHSFNSAAGVITTACLGSIGFASLLMGSASGDGGDDAVRYWVPKGQEDTVWFGALHLESMTKSAFVAQAAKSETGMAGAQGVWSGLPVNVVHIPNSSNQGTPISEGKPRTQFMEGYDSTGKYIGWGGEVNEDPTLAPLAMHNDLIIIFSRCPHLCCIPGWQLVANDFTSDSWLPGGVDSGGNKLFCICHSSRFDPTVIEKNSNRNRNTGAQFDFIGIKRTGGPAPVGMPLIPFEVNGDTIEAKGDFADWYTYCD